MQSPLASYEWLHEHAMEEETEAERTHSKKEAELGYDPAPLQGEVAFYQIFYH